MPGPGCCALRRREQDETSLCSTRPSSDDCAHSQEAAAAALRAPAGPQGRYVLCREVLGGGMKGIVQKGYDPATGRVVAVKRVQCDRDCPVRFLEVATQQGGILSAEGYAPVDAPPASWSGPLAFAPGNAHAAAPFAPDSLAGHIVLLRRGGGVSFAEKLRRARAGGAVGVLFVNTGDAAEVYSLGEAEPALPSIMISRLDGEVAINAVASGASNQELFAQVCTDVGHEIAICRRLPSHPNVARALDSWEEGTSGVIVMEFYRGGKASALPKGPRGLQVALWLTKQMLAGVAHLHAHGICHRDLKPENMLLTRPLEEPGARLVIVDFSMSSTAKRMSVPCGSPRYLAPEVLAGGSYGPERDVWSVGIVAFELIFAQNPYFDLDDCEVVGQLKRGCGPRVESTPDVPEAVCDLLRGLLQAEPSARPSAAGALAHPCLGGIAVPEAEPSAKPNAAGDLADPGLGDITVLEDTEQMQL